MTYDPERHHRRSLRLQGYDYGQEGAYFVTIVTQNRTCLFGHVVDGCMQLNDAGLVAEACWLAIPDHFPHVELDASVIMPNHVHGIIVITENVGAGVGAKNFSPLPPPAHSPLPPPAHSPLPPSWDFSSLPLSRPFQSPSKTLGSIVRGFKIGVTKWMRANTDVHEVWQRNYYEHIIRDETSLQRIRAYIAANPTRWQQDAEFLDG